MDRSHSDELAAPARGGLAIVGLALVGFSLWALFDNVQISGGLFASWLVKVGGTELAFAVAGTIAVTTALVGTARLLRAGDRTLANALAPAWPRRS